ncbi:MAG: TonB-dependent receptor [Gammaproteobacteria bacterium]|nr:TonB-dependent receptor [Gammaproteobacteria bacterium]MXY05078.1 TonB-dependent receptor [Gammaproteobacteria bacterium]MYE52848.1 TonB-dependent receptor [Gammaproteobacteria bacterium]MYE86804.1 TonB-dependent receptor [Gammaproteobacteria bacterium]MYF50013.1 TonB-dependent receptor [Gammaproteobacteria bacterium]
MHKQIIVPLHALVWLAAAAGSWAQAPRAAPVIEEIIVTAEKSQRELSDTAVSITALAGDVLEEFGIADLDGYATLVPGFSGAYRGGPVADGGVRVAGLRGVQSLNDARGSGQNTVGYYIGSTPVPLSNPRLVDVDRVEVLRGPQGTLYGANSLVGTVKLVPRLPSTEKVAYSASASVRSVDKGGESLDFEGYFNVPLAEGVALRASGFYEERGGYIDFEEMQAGPELLNLEVPGVGSFPFPRTTSSPTGHVDSDSNEFTTYGGRAALQIDVNDRFAVRPSILYSKRDLDNTETLSRDSEAIALPFGPGTLNYPARQVDGLTQRAHFQTPNVNEFYLADVTFDLAVGPLDFESSTSYYDSEFDSLRDLTSGFTSLLAGNPDVSLAVGVTHREFTHETLMTTRLDGPLNFVAGLFYNDRKETNDGDVIVPDVAGTLLAGVIPLASDDLFLSTTVRERSEIALFAQATYALTETLSLVVGLRAYEFDFENTDTLGGPLVGGAVETENDTDENGVLPKVRLEYRPNNGNALFFATASKGFRMGGANFPVPRSPQCDAAIGAFFGPSGLQSDFESDDLWNYELGSKLTFAQRRASVAVTAFHIDWDDTQVPVQFPAALGCPFTGLSTNLGSATSRGIEFEAQLLALENLTFAATASYTDTEISEDLAFPGAFVQLASKGDPLPDIPEFTASLMARYEFGLGDALRGYVLSDFRYQDERERGLRGGSLAAAIAGGVPVSQLNRPPFHVLNLRLGIINGRWDVALFANNVTNEDKSLTARTVFASPGYDPIEQIQRPREIGLRVRLTGE